MSGAVPTVVVGGGIGGVTAALALIRSGREVVVLERSDVPVDTGSGITLARNAMAGLDAIGVGDAVRAVGSRPPPGSQGIRNWRGELLLDARGAVQDLYAFHRADLHHALGNRLPDGTIRNGHHVVEVHHDRAGAKVVMADRQSIRAELVVAADGWRSRVRGYLHPEFARPRYAGYTTWRAVTATRVELEGVAGESWGHGERFGILPLHDGRVYWFAVANLPSGKNMDGLNEVRRRFAAWHPPVPEILEATDPGSVLNLDVYDLQRPLPPFAVGNVVLLGDAAHVMTPDIGQGAGQAIEDAVVLAAELARTPNPADALQRYDAARRPRAEKLSKTAHRTGRVAQADGRLTVPLRDMILRLTPTATSTMLLNRMTAWTPPTLTGKPRHRLEDRDAGAEGGRRG